MIHEPGGVFARCLATLQRLGSASSPIPITLAHLLRALGRAYAQIGAAYPIGGSVSGIEVFAAGCTFGKLAHKLLASYALDAVECSGCAEPPPATAVQSFIRCHEGRTM
jgi:hypothetical protein